MSCSINIINDIIEKANKVREMIAPYQYKELKQSTIHILSEAYFILDDVVDDAMRLKVKK